LSGNRSVHARPDQNVVVLVVEDELFVRLMAVDAIEDAGYVAVEAENADRALALLDERSDIAVMFSDIKMPGSLDGLGLAATVGERWPDVRIVLTSGHLYREDIDLPESLPFLQKPYRARELIAELDRVSR
jgi:CheY-like chemotaxis protein